MLEVEILGPEQVGHGPAFLQGQAHDVVEAGVVARMLLHQQAGGGHLVRVEKGPPHLRVPTQRGQGQGDAHPFVGQDDAMTGGFLGQMVDGRVGGFCQMDEAQEFRIVLIAAHIQTVLVPQKVFEHPSLFLVDLGDVDEQDFVLHPTEGPQSIQDIHMKGRFDAAEGIGQGRGHQGDAPVAGVEDAQVVAWGKEAGHLLGMVHVVRPDHDGAAHGFLISLCAQQAVEHRADASDLDAGFMGHMDEEIDGWGHEVLLDGVKGDRVRRIWLASGP